MSLKKLEGTMRIMIPPSAAAGADPAGARKSGIAYPKSEAGIVKQTVVIDDSPYQEVLRSLYDGVLISDQHGKITYANVRAIDFLHYERNELYSLSIHNIISGANESLIDTINENLIKKRFTYIEAYCVRNDGSLFPAEIAVNKLEDPRKGQLCFFVRDITKRKQAEDELHQSVEKTRELLSASPDLMFKIQSDGTFLDFKAAVDSQSEPSSQYIGKNILEVLPAMGNQLWPQIEHAFKIESAHQFEYAIEENGSIRHYEARIVPKGTEAFTIVRDITDRKEAEAKLIRSKEELEQSYKTLLEGQIDIIKSQRLSILDTLSETINQEISHPIGLITTQFATLSKHFNTLKRLLTHYEVEAELSKSGNEDTAKHAEVLKRIEEIRSKEDITHALEEVDQIFNEAKKGLRRLKEVSENFRTFVGEASTWGKIDLNKGIEATIELFQKSINSHCIVHKSLGEVPFIEGHGAEINQVILNLLLNAERAVAAFGEVTIRSYAEGDYVVIQVIDTGTGMPADKLTKVINSCIAVTPTERGAGLGLPMCYSIVHKHHGTIEIESELDRGTTVTVRLPVQQQQQH